MPGVDEVARLREVSAFRTLPDEILVQLIRAGRTRRYRSGWYLFHQGDVSDHLHVVLDGLVKCTYSAANGDKLLLSTIGPGQAIGDVGLVDQGLRALSAQAVRNTVTLALHRDLVWELAQQYPELYQACLTAMSALVRKLIERASELAFLNVDSRLANLLLRVVRKTPGATAPVDVDLGLNQSDLAAMLGASRPAVNRALRRLVDRGVIEMTRRSIVVRDLGQLERQAKH